MRHFPRVPRTVTLKKGSSGFGFSIIGGENGDGIYVSFIVAGGAADLSGELRRGDCIIAVNGVSLAKASHDQAAAALKSSSDVSELVVQYDPERYNALEAKTYEQLEKLPSAQNEGQLKTAQNKTFHVRALFDYDPTKDCDLPCHGLAFKYGDILHLTNATDEEWWRATVAMPGSEAASGVVPSRQRVERKERARIRSVRFRVAANGTAGSPGGSGGRRAAGGGGFTTDVTYSKRSPLDLLKLRKDKRQPELAATADETMDNVASYEEVVPLHLRHARPVILLGFLKDVIRDRLVREHPDSFSCHSRSGGGSGSPTGSRHVDSEESAGHSWPHHAAPVAGGGGGAAGSRVPGLHCDPDAADGFDGVDAAAVRRAAASGRHCILTTSARVINRLHVSGFYPISIFVRPQSMSQILETSPGMSGFQAKDEYESCLLLEREFGKQFTAIIEGDTFDYIFQSVMDVIQNHSGSVVWVPAVAQGKVTTAAQAASPTKGKDKLFRPQGHAAVDASA